MSAIRPPARSGLFLLILASSADSSSGLLSRLVHSDAFTISAGRGLFAFLFITALVIVQRGRAGMMALLHPRPWALAFVVVNACGMVFNMLALNYTAVANFFMIFAIAPFVAAMAGWLVLKERLDTPTFAAALAGFIGVAVMMLAGARSGGLLGDFFALACVCSYSSLILIVRREPDLDILPTLALTMLASALIGLPFAGLASLDSRQWLVMAVFGIVQLGLGNILIFTAVSRVSAAQGGLLGILNAAFAPLWVFTFLGEVPPPATLFGGAIILGAAALHLAWSLRRARPPALA